MIYAQIKKYVFDRGVTVDDFDTAGLPDGTVTITRWGPSMPTQPREVDLDPPATAVAWFINTYLQFQERSIAKAVFLSSKDSLYKLLRCQSDIIRQQFNDLGEFVGAATGTWDPPNIANGAGATSPSFTVTGAAFGDFVDVGVPYSLAGLVCTGFVSAANTVLIRIHNGTGAAVNLASGTWRVVVRRQPGTRTLAQLRTAIENMIDSGALD